MSLTDFDDEESVVLANTKPVRSRLAEYLSSRIKNGRLTVVLPNAKRIVLGTASSGPRATVVVHRWKALARIATASDIGFAKAFMAGECSSPDLAAFFRFILANGSGSVPKVLDWARPVLKLRHALNSNTPRGSRSNILAHYDLGNRFYSKWLDKSMTYSSALYSPKVETLEDAQIAKLQRVVDQLELRKGQDLLEIGCGWGSFAERALASEALNYTGITLSPAQQEIALQRLGEKATARVELRDYRHVTGQFDRIASIEMFEAVGEKYWPVYFGKLKSLLRPGGIAVLQIITIAEERFESYRSRPDFIQRYIFPGGMLPTRTAIAQLCTAAGLKLQGSELFGQSYARTLGEWHDRFQAVWPEIKPLGFDQRFRMMWKYYLDYCRAGFETGVIDVGIYKIVAE